MLHFHIPRRKFWHSCPFISLIPLQLWKNPWPRMLIFIISFQRELVPVEFCYSVLWRRREAAGVLFKFLIAGTAGLWKCQEGSDREDLTNTWGLVESLLSVFWRGSGRVTSQIDPMGSPTGTPIYQTGLCGVRSAVFSRPGSRYTQD